MMVDPEREEIEAKVRCALSNLDEENYRNVIEQLLNFTYPGLTLYIRDTTLSEKTIESYYPRQIILEKTFTECSSFGKGGVPTNCRYTILSNRMVSIDEAIRERDPKLPKSWPGGCGLNISKRNSHFMVLDVYRYEGKTQILLLHLPDFGLWKLFTVIDTLDDSKDGDGCCGKDVELVREVRKRFEERCLLPPDKRIAFPEFLKRWDFPLGMDDNGVFFSINQEVPDFAAHEDEYKNNKNIFYVP